MAVPAISLSVFCRQQPNVTKKQTSRMNKRILMSSSWSVSALLIIVLSIVLAVVVSAAPAKLQHRSKRSALASPSGSTSSLTPEIATRINMLLRGWDVDKRAGYGAADYGHMRFGKRDGGTPNFYGHMRFGKRALIPSGSQHHQLANEWYFPNRDFDLLEQEQANW